MNLMQTKGAAFKRLENGATVITNEPDANKGAVSYALETCDHDYEQTWRKALGYIFKCLENMVWLRSPSIHASPVTITIAC